jgi:hypothetical protein
MLCLFLCLFHAESHLLRSRRLSLGIRRLRLPSRNSGTRGSRYRHVPICSSPHPSWRSHQQLRRFAPNTAQVRRIMNSSMHGFPPAVSPSLNTYLPSRMEHKQERREKARLRMAACVSSHLSATRAQPIHPRKRAELKLRSFEEQAEAVQRAREHQAVYRERSILPIHSSIP